MAIKKVRDAGVVEMTTQESRHSRRSSRPFATRGGWPWPVPGSVEPDGRLLRVSGLSQAAQDKFAPVY